MPPRYPSITNLCMGPGPEGFVSRQLSALSPLCGFLCCSLPAQSHTDHERAMWEWEGLHILTHPGTMLKELALGLGQGSYYKCITAWPHPLSIPGSLSYLPQVLVSSHSFNINDLQTKLHLSFPGFPRKPTCDPLGAGIQKGYLSERLNKLCLFSLTLNKAKFFKIKYMRQCRKIKIHVNSMCSIQKYSESIPDFIYFLKKNSHGTQWLIGADSCRFARAN